MDDMKELGPKIRARREKLGWTQTKLATLAGISQSFLWRIETGKAAGSWETYVKLAGSLGSSIDSFLVSRSNVEPAPADWRKIPIIDYREAAEWKIDSRVDLEEAQHKTIMTALEQPPSTFALQIKGDSMEPKFREGDVVVINPIRLPKPGSFIVANDGTGEAIFRQYRSGGINEKGLEVFELWPLNPLYAPMRSDRQSLAIVGTMTEHRTYES